jgi:hypothetical protein
MRILTFVIWIDDDWSNSNSIAVRLNFSGSSCSNGGGGSCGGGGGSGNIPVCTSNDDNSSQLKTK